jgi:uncharacterized integral membrane protein
MQKTFIGVLVVILLVVLFSLENAQPVSINLWLWSIKSNLSLVLILSVTFGALMSFLFSLPSRQTNKKQIREKKQRIKDLEKQLTEITKNAPSQKSSTNNPVNNS